MTSSHTRFLATAACALTLTLAVPTTSSQATGSGPRAPEITAVTAKPPVTLPADPTGLPAPAHLPTAVDDPAGYQPQTACLARPLPGIVKLRALALETYGRGGTSPAYARPCNSGSASEHKDGRAWDWMLNYANRADRRAAADFLSWVTGKGPSGERGEMAARLGVMYVIYNHRIWSAYSPGWREYSGADPHTSHIHISLSWNGARAHTTFWTGRLWPEDLGVCQVFAGQPGTVPPHRPRTKPCDAPAAIPRGSTKALAWLGSTGHPVGKAQRRLDVTSTGIFDRSTRRAVIGYQKTHDLPKNGTLDEPTWGSLLPKSRVLNVPDWTPARAASWAAKSGGPVIHRADAGKSVYALQVALRLDDALCNGYYGKQSRAAVIALKRSAGLAATALVDESVWNLLPVPPPS
jgi:peptidoglycan hydrolase-like protein with peptidoglycan-binding domain